jgi:hypothetical protein
MAYDEMVERSAILGLLAPGCRGKSSKPIYRPMASAMTAFVGPLRTTIIFYSSMKTVEGKISAREYNNNKSIFCPIRIL